MRYYSISFFLRIALFSVTPALAGAENVEGDFRSGLAGLTFNSEDFSQPDETDVLLDVDNDWGASRGNDWSASWYGFIEGPYDGMVNFSAEANDGIRLRIGETDVIVGLTRGEARSGSVRMKKGEKFPIAIDFTTSIGQAKLILSWQWEGADQSVVPASALSHDINQLPVDIKVEFVLAAGMDLIQRDDPFAQASSLAADLIDLSNARIVVLRSSKILNNAADMLCDEISKRTRLDLEIVSEMPDDDEAVIVIGTGADIRGSAVALPEGLSVPAKADGFALWQDENKNTAVSINLIGHDDRGALYAVGKLLRLLRMERDSIGLEKDMKLATAPRYALRGHQMGYRAKTNSYDAWTVEMWEQYFRDMVVFGMNAVELVPPKTDDYYDSVHSPKPPMEMMIEMSRLADEYGLEIWIWYPVIDDDYSDPVTVEFALREREEVFSKLPRIDAVFVPSGDPGELHPDYLFPLMEKQKKLLNRYHPNATIWSSVQNYDDEPKTMGWTEAFYERLRNGEADWLDGVVFGPATETTLPEMRKAVPERFPIRRYPDITHSKNSQYELEDWDPAYAKTLGREAINPRPRAFARIFRDLQRHSFGFISYSEGCNDDVNKVVWSSLGWNSDMKVEDILAEYARYFISPRYEQAFAEGLFGLESNWDGPLQANDGVYETLERFQKMEEFATPQDKLNWRFQQGLYRAYYDAYIKARLEYETGLERQAVEALNQAGQIGSLAAMKEAEGILEQAVKEKVKAEWRAKIFELGEALYQSIRMQLSVPKYGAKEVGRGANLDLIDVPLNNSRQLKEMFDDIRGLEIEKDRLKRIDDITSGRYEKIEYDWEDIIEESFKDDDEQWSVHDDSDKQEQGPDWFLPEKESDPAMANMPGLAGLICEKWDFREPAARDIIKHLNHNWTGGPGDWSGYYQGFIEGPYTGEVTLYAEVDNGVRIVIGDETVIDGLGRGLNRVGTVTMKKGEKHPFKVWYFQDGDPSYLRVYWSWPGQGKAIIAESAFSYSSQDMRHAVSKLPWEFWADDDAPFHVDGKGSEPLDLTYQDARLLPVVGVENYQVVRSNREHPEQVGGFKNTYLHAPMIAYWNGRYYVEFLAAPVGEHEDPTVTLMTSSADGKNWDSPRILFPDFQPVNDTHKTISHQRMGFYVSKDDRLLILSFYGRWPSPNEGLGIGRAVREIFKDGTIGPLYFIRYNRHAGWNETNTPYPSYKTSQDNGFIGACDELMANRLMVQQWWEEDRSEDGFYLMSGGGFKCKAFNWYTRKDGLLVGLFKAAWTAYSTDNGNTWSRIQKVPSMIVGEAKIWGQQTEDDRYALVYNPHFEWRYPLVVNTSDDGKKFSSMAVVHGELAPMRYQGNAKDVGPQYVRGITPGNGDPPGNDMWLTYSMHKEDIWVSRVPMPIRHKVDEWVETDFNDSETGGTVKDWNIYSLIWAPVNVVEFPGRTNKSLKFSDSEPYDYARAQRVFPESKSVTLEFEVLAEQSNYGRMEIDILNRMGYRPVRLSLNGSGKVEAVDGSRIVEVADYTKGKWLKFKITADVNKETYSVALNGRKVIRNASFAEKVNELQRVSFRTGEYRKLGIGKDENSYDLPNAGDRVTESVYYLNNVSIYP